MSREIEDVKSDPCDQEPCKSARIRYEAAKSELEDIIALIQRVKNEQTTMGMVAAGGVVTVGAGGAILAAGATGLAAATGVGLIALGLGAAIYGGIMYFARGRGVDALRRGECEQLRANFVKAQEALLRDCPFKCLSGIIPFPNLTCP